MPFEITVFLLLNSSTEDASHHPGSETVGDDKNGPVLGELRFFFADGQLDRSACGIFAAAQVVRDRKYAENPSEEGGITRFRLAMKRGYALIELTDEGLIWLKMR